MDGESPTPGLAAVSFIVNGRAVALVVEPRTHLADALREQLNLTGTHLGCEQGVCGACTVLLDGKPQRSCIAYAVDCDGSEITTIEGFDDDPTMAALRHAFSEHHALQCGFCTPGMLITARDIVLRLGEVPEQRIREELSGNLCRCTGYVGVVAAVSAVAAGRTPQMAPTKHSVAVRSLTPSVAARSVEPVSVQPPRAALAGGSVVEQRLKLAGEPDAVWAALSDLPRVAACVPGAELESLQGNQVTGRMRIGLGPVRASFSGTGTVFLDASRREGRISGRGRDSGSGSATEGEVSWRVLAAPDHGSELAVRVSWRLTGTLAQFGRAGLVQDLVRRLAEEFAHNLDAVAEGRIPPPAARPLGLLAMLWGWLKARLLGR
jgi:aerobic-type carbon monoxide dehydrogenase small subunit (CoxS/CutS family)/carbon monoxide dehydrogenase subunit G